MVKRIFGVLLMSGVIAAFTPVTHAAQVAEQGSVRDSHDERQSIVGSWEGTIDDGARILMSFTSDGITHLTLPVLTPAHGAWTHVGGRRFAVTAIGVRYDIQTGADQGSAKLRLFADARQVRRSDERYGHSGRLRPRRQPRRVVHAHDYLHAHQRRTRRLIVSSRMVSRR